MQTDMTKHRRAHQRLQAMQNGAEAGGVQRTEIFSCDGLARRQQCLLLLLLLLLRRLLWRLLLGWLHGRLLQQRLPSCQPAAWRRARDRGNAQLAARRHAELRDGHLRAERTPVR